MVIRRCSGITTTFTMSTEQNHRVPLPLLTTVSGCAHTTTSESAYRKLEQGHRCSEEFAAMQQLYPQLRFWIARCHPSDVVGDPSPQSMSPQFSSALHWGSISW